MHALQRELIDKILKTPVIITDRVWSKCITAINPASEATVDLSALANLLHTTYFSLINNPKPKQIVHTLKFEGKMIKEFFCPIKIVVDEGFNKILVMLSEE